MTNAHPPTGHDWGDRTKQSVRGHRAPGYWETDAYEMGQRYGITDVDVDAFRANHEKQLVYPDLIIHERDPTVTRTEKGTNALVKGKKKGCGKSTLLKHLARQFMSHNDERVVWRGSSLRSEWLAFRKWTTLYLPASADIEAAWMNEESDAPVESIDDLTDVVRDVVYYDDLFDLLEQLGEGPGGTFNVVYPDPSFAGCERVFAQTDRHQGTVPFTPEWDATDATPATPLIHWWYAFIVARVDHGPFQPWTLEFDEGGDIMPSRGEIKQDDHQTFDKVVATRSALADSRRAFLTFVMAVHHEGQLFDEIRKEFDWRIHMPDGSPNPVSGYKGSIPLGFDGVPMNHDIMSYRDVGTALCYQEDGFALFAWPDIPPEPGDESRWLTVELGVSERPVDAIEDETDEVELAFDDAIFGEWQNASAHRLYVKDPGSGYVSVTSGRLGETLESPLDDLQFPTDPLRDAEGCREVVMTDGDSEVVVARLPVESSLHDAGSGGLGVGV